MNKLKDLRRESAVTRFQKQLDSKEKRVKDDIVPLTSSDVTRIKTDITNTKNNIGKTERKQSRKRSGLLTESKEKWFIDIYSVSYGYVKNSERRKNKGKSTKKLRKRKTVGFVRSVVAQEGMITAMKEGRMGVSPKTHVFKMRKEEVNTV